MFVRLLTVLISNILCCFSVLVCCKSLVQIRIQKGRNWGKLKSWPLTVWSSVLRSSARVAIERRHVDPRFPHRPSRPYAPSLQLLRRGNSELVICDQSHIVRSNTVRSNATPTIEHTWRWHGPGTERIADDQTHVGLQLIAPYAIERTSDLAAHLCLSINRTFVISFGFHVWEALLGSKTLCFPLCSPPKLSFTYFKFYLAFN